MTEPKEEPTTKPEQPEKTPLERMKELTRRIIAVPKTEALKTPKEKGKPETSEDR